MESRGIPICEPPERIGGADDTVHVVLVAPLIAPNTGNVARLCAATNTWLHLVEPLGFDLDNRKLKRAGLDYWPSVKLSVHADFESLASRLEPEHAWFFSKFATVSYTDVSFPRGSVLLFGQETLGLGDAIRGRFIDRLLRIPINDNVRSLNLSNSVSIALYEVVRQRGILS